MRSFVRITSRLVSLTLLLALGPAHTMGGNVTSDGDEGWLPGFDAPISIHGSVGEPTCALVYEDALLLAGSLEEVCGLPVGHIARWDGTSWQSYAWGLETHPQCMIEYEGTLVVGGTFVTAGEEPAGYVAAWDGSAWRPLGAGLSYGTGTGVSALCIFRGDLIAGGDFEMAGDQLASRIARWDGSAWHPLGDGVGGEWDARVFALAVYNDELIVGGRFSQAGGSEASNIARWDGSGWSPLDAGVNGTVRALLTREGSLIAGGSFVEAGGVPALHVASWSGSSWSPMGAGLGPAEEGQTVTTLGEYGGEVYAGGSFSDAIDPNLSSFARWDAGQSTWSSVGAGLNGHASALVEFSGSLYICGGFSQAGPAIAQNIARWGGEWSALCTPPTGLGLNGPAHSLAIYQGELAVGGEFSNAGGAQIPDVAHFDGTEWHPYGSGPNGPVYLLGEIRGALEAAGVFAIDGQFPLAALAQWLPGGWEHLYQYNPVGSPPFRRNHQVTAFGEWRSWACLGWHSSDDNSGEIVVIGSSAEEEVYEDLQGDSKYARATAVYRDRLIVGGSFLSVAGIPARRIAAWDSLRWSPLGEGIGSTQGSATVRCLIVIEDTLYTGGRFATAEGRVVNNIAKWDGERWSPLGSTPGCDGQVLALANVHGNLIAGGDFSHAGGVEARSIAQWDGHNWTPLGSGTNGIVESLVFDGTTIFAGGTFTLAGGLSSHYIAAWTPMISSVSCPFSRLTAGQSELRTITLQNPRDEILTLTLRENPDITPFAFSDTFADSLQHGIDLPPHGSIRTRVRFAPTEAGIYNQRIRFLLSPIGREIQVDLSGSARELTLDWTSRGLYEPSYQIAAGDSVYVEVTLGDSVSVETLDLKFREGGATLYLRQPMHRASRDGSNERYEGYVPGDLSGPRGIDFYVEGANGLVSARIGDSASPIRMRVNLPNVGFPGPQPASTYRVLSVPLQLPDAWIKVVFGDDLGSADPASWRMFSYDSDSLKYDDLSLGEEFLHQGRGYWLITRGEPTLDTEPIAGISTPGDSAYAMTIKPGWNLIGNPFAFFVPWDSVRVEGLMARPAGVGASPTIVRDMIERPVAWNGSEYLPDVTVIQPFQGYWVHSAASGPILLRIPPHQDTGPSPDKADVACRGDSRARRGCTLEKDGEWTVRIGASNPRSRDTYNYAGMRRGAIDGRDGFDRTEPPMQPGGGIALYFSRAGGDREAIRLATDMRGPIARRDPDRRATEDSLGMIWPFDMTKTFLAGDEGDQVTLSFDWTGDLPEDVSAVILDRDLGVRIDPLAGQPYSFVLGVRSYVEDPSVARFVLLVGSRQFLDEETADQIIRPRVTLLYTPSPNPSSGPMSLRFDLSDARRARVSVHDISGAQVRLLCDGERPSGRHQLTWNGRDDRGRPLASGVYFIRFESNGADQAKKIVVIR